MYIRDTRMIIVRENMVHRKNDVICNDSSRYNDAQLKVRTNHKY